MSYGPGRSALEDINVTVQRADQVKYAEVTENPYELPYSFTLASGLEPPSIMLATPRLAEIYGAGFSKAPGSKAGVMYLACRLHLSYVFPGLRTTLASAHETVSC